MGTKLTTWSSIMLVVTIFGNKLDTVIAKFANLNKIVYLRSNALAIFRGYVILLGIGDSSTSRLLTVCILVIISAHEDQVITKSFPVISTTSRSNTT